MVLGQFCDNASPIPSHTCHQWVTRDTKFFKCDTTWIDPLLTNIKTNEYSDNCIKMSHQVRMGFISVNQETVFRQSGQLFEAFKSHCCIQFR